MNGGYIIIKDDISSKIKSGVPSVDFKGAFNYASEVFRTKKIALISVESGGAIVYEPISQILVEGFIIWYAVGPDSNTKVTFNSANPDKFTVQMEAKNGNSTNP